MKCIMRKKLAIILIIYSILSIFLFKYFQYYAVSDVVAYLDIAKKYLVGDFFNGINGIWGVLISWLLVPFLLVGIKPLVSFKILNLIIGGLTIIGFDKLCKRFALNEQINFLLLLITLPAVLSFALVHTTPDLLAVCVLLYYLDLIFDENYEQNIWNGVCVGLLGGIGYLTKHYIFYFILIHLLLSHLFKFFYKKNDSRKKIATNLLVSYFVFLIISVSWIYILSNKYGFFTVGTSMDYNRAWMSPLSQGHAPEYLGLLEPSNPSANSMWEDLTYYVKFMPDNKWSPLSSVLNFKYQIILIFKNLSETFLIFNKFSLILGPIIFLLGVIYVIKNIKKRDILVDKVFLSLVVIILYSSGYLLIRTSDRYVWIDYFLLLLMGGLYFNKFYSSLLNLNNRKLILSILFIIYSLSFIVTPIRRLMINIYQDKKIYDLSVLLRDNNVSGRIASNANWSDTSILSYYLNTKYYGVPVKYADSKALVKQLDDSEINYYLEWVDSKNISSLKDVNLIFDDAGLKVYKLK